MKTTSEITKEIEKRIKCIQKTLSSLLSEFDHDWNDEIQDSARAGELDALESLLDWIHKGTK